MTSQTEEVLGIVENIAKMKKLLNELKELTNIKPIDRGRCIQILSELYAPSSALVISFATYFAKHKDLSKRVDEFVQNTLIPWMDSLKRTINIMVEFCNQKTLFNDNAVSYLVSVFYGDISSTLSSIHQLLDIPFGLKHLASLIEKHKFDSNWIVAVAYLAAMEIAVNKKIGELRVSVKSEDSKDHFKNRVDALLKELEKRGVQLGELEKLLPPVFWNLRNKVIHVGYTPSDEELQIVVTTVDKFLEKLGGLRTPY